MSKQNDDISRLRELALDRDEARDSFKDNMADTKDKLKPGNLAKRAKKIAVHNIQIGSKKVAETIKENPVISASVAASVLTAGAVAVHHKSNGKNLDTNAIESPQTED